LLVAALVAALTTQALADAQGDVKNAMIQFSKLTSYHMTAHGLGKTIDADIVNPGKMHVVMGSMELIRLDTTTYVKINGEWRKFAFPGMDRLSGPAMTVQQLVAHKGDFVVSDLGPKTIDGATLHAYTVKATEGPATTMYLDASGNLARADTGEGYATFSKFNAPITIDAPI
jgi:hypothetical protein